jgi:lipopolysaccharide export system protein LptC
MTYWPLTEERTAERPAAPVRSASADPKPAPAGAGPTDSVRTNASQPSLMPAKPALFDRAQPAGPSQRSAWETPSMRLPSTSPAVPTRTGGYLAIVSRRGARRVPTYNGMLRRRLMINASKFLLPAVAVLLLSSIALWPEFDTATDRARFSLHGISATMDGARLTDAHYNGVDERGRPYTVTAATATQRDAQRIDLTVPNADITLENGTWIDVKSKQGVYIRNDQQLDLSNDVVMYRDDGTTLTTNSATVAMKDGAASSNQPTHVEGPFGTLDASGFTTVDKGAAIQFWGPVRVELNGVTK